MSPASLLQRDDYPHDRKKRWSYGPYSLRLQKKSSTGDDELNRGVRTCRCWCETVQRQQWQLGADAGEVMDRLIGVLVRIACQRLSRYLEPLQTSRRPAPSRLQSNKDSSLLHRSLPYLYI